MTFFLEHNRDSALLAMVIREGHYAASKEGRSLGRTAVQKMMYFLDVLGVPMGYRFEIHHYGPFCAEILQDTEWLVLDGVVEERSASQGSYSDYGPGPNIDNLLESYREDLDPYDECLRVVAKVFAPLPSSDLELYATLDYLYREQKARGGEGPWKERVIDRFMQVKKDKFLQEKVSRFYDKMVSAKLVMP